jgi:flavin reductase (DIM6/NTAB) family NADH-FMN oxidoreductase RutF
MVSADGCGLELFEVEGSANHCLPRRVLWRRNAQYAYDRWRASARGSRDVRMMARDVHAHFVAYICPRPVFLASVADGGAANMFPMDLVGPVGPGHVSLALHSEGPLALLERSRRLALSSVPYAHASTAHALGRNHARASIAWRDLPFETIRTSTFGLAVPAFALRVRELEIVSARRLGSHTLHLAKVVHDERRGEGEQMFHVHGFYEAWRRSSKSLISP